MELVSQCVIIDVKIIGIKAAIHVFPVDRRCISQLLQSVTVLSNYNTEISSLKLARRRVEFGFPESEVTSQFQTNLARGIALTLNIKSIPLVQRIYCFQLYCTSPKYLICLALFPYLNANVASARQHNCHATSPACSHAQIKIMHKHPFFSQLSHNFGFYNVFPVLQDNTHKNYTDLYMQFVCVCVCVCVESVGRILVYLHP